MMQTYEAIRPLGDGVKKAVLESDVLFTDDSIIPLQVKGNGKVHKARLWAYVRGAQVHPSLCMTSPTTGGRGPGPYSLA